LARHRCGICRRCLADAVDTGDHGLPSLERIEWPERRNRIPIRHEVDAVLKVLRVYRTGSITTHDEMQAQRARLADKAIVPGIPVVVDCTGVSPSDNTQVVRYLAERAITMANNVACGRLAIVVATDVEYGMARMYMSLADATRPDTMVFRNSEEALAWALGNAS
jgi:hypothetical protein